MPFHEGTLSYLFCLFTRGINLKKIADQAVGASGAELKGICTEAGRLHNTS